MLDQCTSLSAAQQEVGDYGTLFASHFVFLGFLHRRQYTSMSASDTATASPSVAPQSPAAQRRWYQLDIAQTEAQLGTSAETGISDAEAATRLGKYGPNELVEQAGRSKWAILVEQFTNILTILLIAAAIISGILGDWIEAIVIGAIVILNGILGFTQEYRAERSIAALKKLSVPTVRVRRGGRLQEVPATEIVPGDVVVLETGNLVPADGRVLQSLNLRAMEAALTGESEGVEKDESLLLEGDPPLGDRKNMVYSGTVVSYGHGEMIVTDTGMQTELGKIANLLQSVEEEQTPLQQRLDKLGRWLAIAAIGLVIVIFVVGVAAGQEVERMLLTAVSLAVAAIPEALTAVVTIALSLGAQRMLKRRALIRQLPAVETLGSVTYICSDKTGTLTQNRMTVTALDIADHRIAFTQDATSDGFRLLRDSSQDDKPVDAEATPELLPTLDLLLVSGALANDAVLEQKGDDNHYVALGDPTEGALILAAAEYGILKPELEKAFPRLDELPFDSVRKRMTTVHATPDTSGEVPRGLRPIWERRTVETPPYVAFTKGAIDGMLSVSSSVWVDGEALPLDEEWKRRLMKAHDDMAAKGMRILGVGVRALDHKPSKEEVQGIEEDLTLVGLYGMIDPPRPEVREAVERCHSAGIHTVMITGDHPLTARHIAWQVGITDSENAPFLTGQEIDRLTPDELRDQAKETQVYARVSPEHKLTLIDVYQGQGNIVAMTGDGVNDAPALKKADIGVAMGITGTDVSKEAAQMVLLDDNFATIVAAVEEGRTVYDNIRKFIKYLLSCNASEIAVMLLWPLAALIFGIALGGEAAIALLPLQILWMNLVTDGLPALALGVEPAELNVMNRPPYSTSESIFGRGMVSFILVFGVFMSVLSTAIGLWAYTSGDPAWQTLLFTTLVFNQIALALAVRSEEQSLLRIGFFSNRYMVIAFFSTIILQLLVVYVPFLQVIFGTLPLNLRDLLIAFGLAIVVFLAVEVWKWNIRRKQA